MPPTISSLTVAQCVQRGREIAAEIGTFALARDVAFAEVEKLRSIAERVFPILLWKVLMEEVAPHASAIVQMAMLIPFGISVSALQRMDIPMEVRQLLLPVLRPDAHVVTLVWWDNVAIPSWVRPYLLSLPLDRFEETFHLDQR